MADPQLAEELNPKYQKMILESIKNPKDQKDVDIVRAYKASITPRYDRNTLVPAKYAPIHPDLINEAIGSKPDITKPPPGTLITPFPDKEAGSKFAEGAVTGYADMMNPLQVPHFAETLAKMPFQNPKEGESRLEAASKAPHFFQPLDIKQLDTLGNTAVKGLYGAITGNKTSIGDIYDKEVANYDKAMANPDVSSGNTTGQVLAFGQNAAGFAKDVFKAVPKLTKAAYNKAFEALKPTGKYADKIISSGRAPEIGKEMIDNNILTAGATYKDMLSRTQQALSNIGEKIGYFAKTADKAVGADSSLRGVSVGKLTKDIESKIVGPLSEQNSSTAAKNVQNWVEELKANTGGQDLSFERAQKIKTALGQEKAKFQSTNDSVLTDAYQDIYSVLNKHIEDGIDVALKKAAPEITNEFKSAKKSFQNLSDAERFLNRTVAAQAKNRGPSLTDYGAGISGSSILSGIGMHANGVPGAILGAGMGLGAGVLNKLARTRGNQVVAAGLNTLAKTIESIPKTNLLPGLAGSVSKMSK